MTFFWSVLVPIILYLGAVVLIVLMVAFVVFLATIINHLLKDFR